MSFKYKEYELIEFDVNHINFMYDCRNQFDFDNFWFFPKTNVNCTEFLDELKTLIKDEIIYDLFLIQKNGIQIGFLLSYNYKEDLKKISLSVYIRAEYRNGYNLLNPFLIIFNYYRKELMIDAYVMSVYNANRFVINFLKRLSIFDEISKDRIYSEFMLDHKNLPFIFEKCNFLEQVTPNFYSINDFPRLKKLVDNTKIITNELNEITDNVMYINRAFKSHAMVRGEIYNQIREGEKYGWIKGWDYSNLNFENCNWLQYGIMFNDEVPDFLDINLTNTILLLKAIKGVKVAAFVKLKPRTILHSHTHEEIEKENLLQFHLTLTSAVKNNFAYLNVNGEFRQHNVGEAIIFDGSLPHFALNESEHDRVILYLEFSKSLMYKD